jgi:predicted ATPase/DNA-binding CsgD family transcriptional regulator
VSTFRKSLVSTQLFGRNQELETIQNMLQLAKESNGQCLLISGDAGIGKSRLTAAAIQSAQQEDFILLHGVCFEQDSSLPYGPWMDGIRQYLALKTPEQIVENLGENTPEILKLIPEVSVYLNTSQPIYQLPPEADKRRLFEALLRFLGRLTGHQPLLVVLEDLHWGDETSLEFLHYCRRRFSQHPVLLIGTYRQDQISPQLKRLLSQMNRERLAVEIQLSPLSRHHVAEMIRSIFEIERPIKLDFLDMIEQLTGGNPFFVEEVLKSLVETGGIYLSNGVWKRRPVVELQVPSSTRDAVQGRLELLNDETQHLVTLMSVAGQQSTFELLQTLTKMEEGELIQRLKELIEAQFITETGPDQFSFRHELTREAVYAGLMQRERMIQHRMIAETVEAVFADHLDMYLGSLAMHYQKSRQWEKALHYARVAGEKALALYAPREALEHFNQAVEAAQQLSLKADIDLLRSRGLACQLMGNFDTAYSDFQSCLEQARKSGNKNAEWEALLNLALLMEGRNYPKAGEYNQEALALARQLNDPAMIGRSLIRLTIWYTNMNQAAEGAVCVREAFNIFEGLNDQHGLALALSAEGNIHINAGNFQRGAACFTQAIPLFKAVGDLQGQFDCLINLSLCGAIDLYYTEPPMMSISRARRNVESALEIARQMNSQSDEAIAMIRLAMILRTQGRYAQASELAENATELAEDLEHSEWSSFGWAAQAEIQRDLLNLDLAQKYYMRSLEKVEQTGNLEIKHTVMANLARVYLDQKQVALAENLLNETLPEEDQINTMAERLIRYGFARLELEKGQPQNTIQILDSLLESSIQLSGQEDLQSPYLNFMRGDALVRLGRVSEARHSLQKARSAAADLGGLPLLWRIQYSLAKSYREQDAQSAEREMEHAREIVIRLAEALPNREQRTHFVDAAFALLTFSEACPSRNDNLPNESPLTVREMEVVDLIKAGKSNQEIADILVLSKRTVEKHISNILFKLMLNTRAQIIVWGLQNEPPG